MAHELTTRADGMTEFAFSGSRDNIWHSLGQEIDQADLADLDNWKVRAGMDWDVLRSPATFSAFNPDLGLNENKLYPNTDVLFRSDSQEPLGIVGNGFKIVQPGQVIDFFNDLVQHHGFQLSSAGTLFGGRRFWALADVGKQDEVVAGDKIDGHLLLITAVDGSLATTARFVTTRVVCNNTLQAAVREGTKKPVIKVTHRTQFDPDKVKIDLGVIDKAWATFMADMRKLSNKKMGATETRSFFEKQIFDPSKSRQDQGWGIDREVERLVDLALGGSGSDFYKGTAYGALCAATEFYTHGSGKRDASHQFWSAYMGDGETKKQKVLDSLLALA